MNENNSLGCMSNPPSKWTQGQQKTVNFMQNTRAYAGRRNHEETYP